MEEMNSFEYQCLESQLTALEDYVIEIVTRIERLEALLGVG